MLSELAHRTIGQRLHVGTRAHQQNMRVKPNGAATIDRAVRRVAALVATLAAFLTVVQVAAAQAEPMPEGIPGTWALRVNKEFTGAGLNTALWTGGWQSDASITGPISNECEASKNVYQPGNGYIYLQLRKEAATCGTTKVEDTGAVIESNPSDGQPGHSGFAYTYGIVEWEASLPGIAPTGRGCPKGGCLPDWPALWSLSSTNADEIDTMEGLETLGQDCYHIHPPPGSEGPGACLTGSYAGWHKYASEWEPGVVKFFVDGAQVGELSSGELNGTPQYLIADIVYPGCCNQPVQVPDEMTINYVRVWQHPVAPSVTTGAATGLQPLQATLNGEVNPNGWETYDYFQYGTSISYGSKTGEVDAGAGTGVVGASATSTGLSPGTTYHYRLVARNSVGETVYGGDKTFTTPSKPKAVTSPASGIDQTQATLNGSVNPKGYDGYSASYHFEYGTTPYYGSSVPVPEGNAGSGTTPVAESYTVTKLEPGATYYYRLVANNTWGTSYGSAETFTTPEMEVSSGSAVRDANSGDQWVYYTNSSGGISEWNWNGSTWHGGTLGGSIKTGTRPMVVRAHNSGDIWVYYANSSGEIAEWNWDSSTWHGGTLGGSVKAKTSPNVVRDPYTGDLWVYYVNSSGEIAEWNWDSSTWHGGTLGGDVKAGASPTVLREPHNGDIWVYYADSGEAISEWNWNGSVWRSGMDGIVEAGSSPSVIREASTGDQWVYYVNSSGGISEWNWNSATWTSNTLGGSVKRVPARPRSVNRVPVTFGFTT